MCGIMGFSKNTPATRKMEPILAVFMSNRGKDSWGVTDGEFIARHPENILDSWEDYNLEAPTYHTRGASVGSVKEENCHPFECVSKETGLTVVGVHNGHLSNWEELKRKYTRPGEVDSEQIFWQLAEGKPVEEVAGWMACVWYEYPTGQPEKRQRFISRHNNTAMHVARLKTKEKEYVFASTKDSIEVAAQFAGVEIETWMECKEDWKYELTSTQYITHGPLLWGKSPLAIATTWKNGQGRGGSCYGYGSRVCIMPRCTRQAFGDSIICNGCLCKIAYQYYGVEGVKLIDPELMKDYKGGTSMVTYPLPHDRRLVCL